MSAAFTPGPWHADKLNAWSVWASDCKVAKTFDVNQAVQYREPSEEERIANAHLIAAAPAMFEALTNLRNAALTYCPDMPGIEEANVVLVLAEAGQ